MVKGVEKANFQMYKNWKYKLLLIKHVFTLMKKKAQKHMGAMKMMKLYLDHTK